MEKVLILSCSTGEGHNSAAAAIEHALQMQGVSCERKDPVSFKSQRMTRLVSSLYNDTIRKAPAVFGAVYRLGDLYSSTGLPSPVYWANARYSENLKNYILEEHFDAVICTHLYGMEAMTAIRKNSDFHVPCFGVLTDYVCIPFIEETELDCFFVPNEEARRYLAGKGIPEDRLVVSGIPVSDSFRHHLSREEARKKLDIPMDRNVFLLMTGGVGCESMEGLCSELAGALTEKDQLLILTGRNEKLKERLDQKFGSDAKVRTVSFTREVPSYMAAADVLLSKPGGLSSTEAAVANIPLVHIHEIPGCETYNARFFADHGMARRAENDAQAVAYAVELAHDSAAAEKMRMKQRACINPDAANMIIREVRFRCIMED